MMILLLFRWRADVGEWIDVVGMGVDVCMITNGPSGNCPRKYIGNQWFCSAIGVALLV